MNSKNSNEHLKKQKIQERISFFINNKRSSKPKKVINSSDIYKYKEENNGVDENNMKKHQNIKNSIPIKKEIGKFAEPRFKISHFEKLLPKFNKSVDISFSELSQSSIHEITNSEIEMLEIDEKLPQKKLDLIESRRNNDKSINNTFLFKAPRDAAKFILVVVLPTPPF